METIPTIELELITGVHIKGTPYPEHMFDFPTRPHDIGIRFESNEGIAAQLDQYYTANPSATRGCYFYMKRKEETTDEPE